jgi:hypothetical protein
MKTIEMHVTDDGKYFKDEREALIHEKKIELVKNIRSFVKKYHIKGACEKDVEEMIFKLINDNSAIINTAFSTR